MPLSMCDVGLSWIHRYPYCPSLQGGHPGASVAAPVRDTISTSINIYYSLVFSHKMENYHRVRGHSSVT